MNLDNFHWDQREAPPAHSVAALFGSIATAFSARTAVRHRDTELTYGELALVAGGIARLLRENGVGPGDVVATVLDRSTWSVGSMLGVLAAGAVFLNLEMNDPEERLAALIEQASPSAVLTDPQNAGRLPSRIRNVFVLDQSTPRAPYVIADAIDSESLAYLVHTSGSSGDVKSVEISHGAVLNHHRIFWKYLKPITRVDSVGVVTTFAADISLIAFFGALLSGARLDVYDRNTTLDADLLTAELARHPVDFITYVPSLLAALAGQRAIEDVLPRKVITVGGEVFPPSLARAIFDARPELLVINGYGPSEATMEVTMHLLQRSDADAARIPVGRPLDGITLRLLDDRGRLVPDGIAGVLYIGGDCLARGYRGDKDLTAAKFSIQDNGDRLYRTDDVMIRREDGSYDFVGRADRQLKIRGNRVEPGEVEAALLRMKEIGSAVVVGEERIAGGPVELTAYVVLHSEVEPGEIIRQLGKTLTRALIPSRVSIVPGLPLTSNGKIDMFALRCSVEPAIASTDSPRSESEIFVAGLWEATLGLNSVGREVPFMEVGGDSLSALRVFAGLRQRFPDVGISQIFEYPTVAALAAALDNAAMPNKQGLRTSVVEL